MPKTKKTKKLTVRLTGDRAEYFDHLQEMLSKEANRNVSGQEIVMTLLDICREGSTLIVKK